MIFIDTSVWIAYFRGSKPVSEQIDSLLYKEELALAIPVQIEILSGVLKSETNRISRILSALPLIYPTELTWRLLDQWLSQVVRGQHFGFGDLLIAALTHENQGQLWSLDKDFQRMASLKLIKLFHP